MLNLIICLVLLGPSDSSYQYCITTANRITFHYQSHSGKEQIGTINNLVKQDRSISFAMNGSMYTPDFTPVGLYVENGTLVSHKLLVNDPATNFGIAPQVVFYIDKKGIAGMIDAAQADSKQYKYAVELAPLLVKNGQVYNRVKGMNTKYIRNAIGVLKDGKILLLISTRRVTMEQLANKMRSLGCVSAAYVDGGVSEAWQKGEPLPADPGKFAVLVATHYTIR